MGAEEMERTNRSLAAWAVWAVAMMLVGGGVRAQNAPPPERGTATANAPSAGTSATATKRVTLLLPPGGKYVAWVAEHPAAPPQVASGDRITLDLDPAAARATIVVLDEASGYVARREVDVRRAPSEIALASGDFRYVRRLVVEVTGKESRPLARGRVTVRDANGRTDSRILEPADGGKVEFSDVAQGKAEVTVVPEGGAAVTREIVVDVPKGRSHATVQVAIPDATAVLDVPTAANAPALPSGAAGNLPAPPSPPGEARELPPPSDATQAFVIRLLGFVILAALIGGGIYFARQRGWTVQEMLLKLGVKPDTGSAPAADPALARPLEAPPPPVVADPNRCQFCGELKDATGQCACSLGAAAFGAATPAPTVATPGPSAAGSGTPRLIGLSGLYLGHIFPLSGEATIGREVGNTIVLDRDSTVSRRHAVIEVAGGGYVLRDLGSSNGTFVNGARVSERPLQPGDEITLGATRFRFEV